ncbi:MAG: GNAT family N-acetyltransferase [Tissierellia bacterium]|nr:GNAT family N-acetyltransferase [Tissierellia bacterium]
MSIILKNLSLETERTIIKDALPSDIDFIMEMENDKDNKDFVWQGTYEDHQGEINDPDYMLLVIVEKESLERIGFFLMHYNVKSKSMEIRRIAINKKGLGYARETLRKMIDFSFKEVGANRVWLDCYTDNLRGIPLYESLAFKREGILRESYLSDSGFKDQIIFSILKAEWTRN